MFVKGRTPLRDSFDLTIAVACGFSEYMYKGENPQAKASAPLLQIQMNLYAMVRLKSTTLSGSEVVRKDLKRVKVLFARFFVT
ncbi:hypothetical protein U3G77_13265 [Paenibacillus polymyxa]|uniref:hypothetical protein n=1 Tax=Paenibacillus polymyxa TaxID=1406 RepID=UPI0004D40226|nr:hypothetical protein [Paenibacillus polymyxa]KEO79382.1 hypothetical protein EL23_07810 [Paenibacillus polymyxa]MDY8093336.1 hypothetical protein [Paenibacillus polymyxa]WRL59159.1 hypothetical protein U3G77_13265 [Paenibacillus polymyxa]